MWTGLCYEYRVGAKNELWSRKVARNVGKHWRIFIFLSSTISAVTCHHNGSLNVADSEIPCEISDTFLTLSALPCRVVLIWQHVFIGNICTVYTLGKMTSRSRLRSIEASCESASCRDDQCYLCHWKPEPAQHYMSHRYWPNRTMITETVCHSAQSTDTMLIMSLSLLFSTYCTVHTCLHWRAICFASVSSFLIFSGPSSSISESTGPIFAKFSGLVDIFGRLD